MGLFSRKKTTDEGDIKESVKLIRDVLSKIGINGTPQPIDGGKGFGWVLQRGSAVVYVMINDVNGKGYFKVVSPIIYLPAENLLPFYRAILEINMELTSAALGVQEDKICVVSERSIAGLDSVEADEIIKRVAYYADELDNKLVSEFGGRLFSDPHGR
jgi:hypothetical protein